MGLINNLFACYLFAFVLISHGSLLLCLNQQSKQLQTTQQQAETLENIPTDIITQYNCPQIPEQIIEVYSALTVVFPIQIQQLFNDIYSLAGNDIVNILIWIGTMSLIGDAFLILYYVLVKPLSILKSIVGAIIRLAVFLFTSLFIIHVLTVNGIIPKQEFMDNFEFLQLDNLYKIALNSSGFITKKIKSIFKKYL